MTTLADQAGRLLRLGTPANHAASAIVGVRAGDDVRVETAGRAVLGGTDDPGEPMTRDLLLDLASVTKVAATTALAMRLVADGSLRLDDAVSAHLPDVQQAGEAAITMRHLLTHTAGLQPWWPLYLETTDPASAVARALELPLVSAPGTRRQYSDIGLILAGAVVEQIAGLTLRDAHRLLIAEPLGLTARFGPVPQASAAAGADSDAYEFRMVDSGLPYPVPFAAEQFGGWRDRVLRGEANDGNAAHALGGAAGHAGLFSTIDDLLTLGAALRGGSFVPRDVLRQFATPSDVDPEQAVGFRRAVVAVDGEEVALLWHGGFTGTWFGFALDRDLVVAGAAMRLHGTLGGIPRAAEPGLPELVPADAIADVMLDTAAETLRHTLRDRITLPTTDAEAS